MCKILFINPVVRAEDVPRHIPMGIALLAAIAEKRGDSVAIYDANAWRQPISKVADACKAEDWDVIAIGGLSTTFGFIKQAVRIARECSPKALIVAGGGFLTSMPAEVMDWLPEIDVGVVGEAFKTFAEILEKVDDGDFDFSETLGVIYRDPAGPVLNAARPVIHDLDTIPWPAWHLFPLESIYFPNSSSLFSEEAHLAKRRIDINGSYGCSLVCSFCWHLGTTGDMLVQKDESTGKNDVVFTYGRNLRYHSPEYLVAMVKELKRKYQIDFANFLDENLMTMEASSGRKWLTEICDEWDRAGLRPVRNFAGVQPGVFWSGTSHASLHRPDILRRMHDSGCTHLVYGLESFDPHILKNLGKGTTRQKNIDSIGICMASGIIPIPNIIIGFPEETYESIRNTVTALVKLGIHARPHFATAYPGSEWFYNFKESIRRQYGGDLEAYILDLGDATKITATISQRFTGVELLGLQEIVAKRDLRLLALAEATDTPCEPLHVKEASFNFRAKKIDGPMEVAPV